MADILSTSPAGAEAEEHRRPGEGDAVDDGQKSLWTVPTAADVENLASEGSPSTAPLLRPSASRTSVASGRSTGRRRSGKTEKLLERLGPHPSMPPPPPPVEGVTVKKYQELGHMIRLEEQLRRSGSSRPPSIVSQAPSTASAPIRITKSNGNASVNERKAAQSSPPNMFPPFHHYQPNPPKDAPPQPPVATPAQTPNRKHPGVEAVLSSPPAFLSMKSLREWFLPSGNSTTPPAVQTAPGAHQSPAIVSSTGSRASMSGVSLASSAMESTARSGGLDRQSRPVRTGPSGTIRAPSRASAYHNPGMQWSSDEEHLASMWSTSEDASARVARDTRPVYGFLSSAAALYAEQSHRRKMGSDRRFSVSSNYTTTSSISSASSRTTTSSNSSVWSLSTAATSVSGMSKWENPGAGVDAMRYSSIGPPVTVVESGFVGPDAPPESGNSPTNTRRMDGMPRDPELDGPPRAHQL